MGDIADMMLDGALCEGCGAYMGGGDGYPQRCAGCRTEDKKDRAAAYQPPKPKVKCSVCARKVKPTGLADHMRDSHGVTA